MIVKQWLLLKAEKQHSVERKIALSLSWLLLFVSSSGLMEGELLIHTCRQKVSIRQKFLFLMCIAFLNVYSNIFISWYYSRSFFNGRKSCAGQFLMWDGHETFHWQVHIWKAEQCDDEAEFWEWAGFDYSEGNYPMASLLAFWEPCYLKVANGELVS